MIVAFICHFTNEEIQNILKPRKSIGEFAPWIPSIIRLFENNKNMEIHIISPHEYIKSYKTFKLRNVYYHFFNAHITIIGRHWPGFLKMDYWTNFLSNKKEVFHIVKDTHPDVIHLIGVENAYYSSSILQFYNKIPIVITIQGFIFKTSLRRYQIKKRIKIENEIIRRFNYYITNTNTVGKDIITINPNANIYQINLPIKAPKPIDVKKNFDLVFFARVCKDKGIEDLLKAVAIIKEEVPDVNLCVIGGGKTDLFKKQANELGLNKNVYWAGFLPTQDDVHKLASRARISVLPTYHDIISGTIIESLFLKLPVVAYNVGSIHEVNTFEKIISLVKKADIQSLARTIVNLLKDEKFQEEIAAKGRKRAIEMFKRSDHQIKEDFLNAYKNVISDFNKS